MKMPLPYCGEQIRQYDPDRFLLSLLVPAEKRPAIWAACAFAHEIARTQDVTTDSALARIRLQWWRQTIEDIYAGKNARTNGPLAEDLAAGIKKHSIPNILCMNLIQEHEYFLETGTPETIEDLQNMACAQTLPLDKIIRQITGDAIPDHPLSNVSSCYSLIKLMRSVPYHIQNRRPCLPETLLKEHNLTHAKLHDFDCRDRLAPIILRVLDQVAPYRNTGSRYYNAVAKLTQLYTAQIRKLNGNVFLPSMAAPPPFKALRVTYAALLPQ